MRADIDVTLQIGLITGLIVFDVYFRITIT